MNDSPAGTGALQTVFALFLGLMVTAVIGVGVYTFYPSPQGQFRDELERVSREEEAARLSKAPDALTADDREKMRALADRRNRAEDANRAEGERWGRRTSIVLVALATLTMMISLASVTLAPALTNGLMLGGVFTMLYGVGWIIVTDSSMARFIVTTVALGITLLSGYLRFSRTAPAPYFDSRGAPGAANPDLSEIEARVEALERRVSDAARALARSEQLGPPRS